MVVSQLQWQQCDGGATPTVATTRWQHRSCCGGNATAATWLLRLQRGHCDDIGTAVAALRLLLYQFDGGNAGTVLEARCCGNDMAVTARLLWGQRATAIKTQRQRCGCCGNNVTVTMQLLWQQHAAAASTRQQQRCCCGNKPMSAKLLLW
jgi:hypothetical protein